MSDLHVHFHGDVAAGATLVIQVPATGALAAQLTQLKELITMNFDEATALVKGQTELLVKIGGETSTLLAKVADLQTVIDSMNAAGQTVPQELADALTALSAQATVVDNLVPDAAPAA